MICIGDARHLPIRAESVQCCVTSPPYFNLRDYQVAGQIGLEPTPEEFVVQIVAAFREVWRVLKPDGTLWLNIGDSYAANRTYQVPSTKGGSKHSSAQGSSGGMHVPPGLKPKDLIGIPWMVAFALRADGWYLRSEIIWHKPNPMPESVTDRVTKAHEQLFMLTKQERYYYDYEAVLERKVCYRKRGAGRSKHNADRNDNGDMAHFANTDLERGTRNKRSVWTIATEPCAEAHFAVMPEALVEPCILAGSRPGDLILDPFAGSGTVGRVAAKHLRQFIGTELKPDYATMAHRRQAGIQQSLLSLAEVEA